MNYEDKKIIDNIVENMLTQILSGKDVRSGHNGPYNDKEKAGRNVSHWICTFKEYYIKTKNPIYKKAIKLLSAYYSSNLDYTEYGVYFCREKKGKDSINGVIGLAWIIEGLVSAYDVLREEYLLDRAIHAFKAFPFDYNNGMWERIEVNGHNLGLDDTYNHQLWFAASGAEILNYKFDKEIYDKINIFLEKSSRTFFVMPNGLICHFANCYNNSKQLLINLIKYVLHSFEIYLKKPSLEYKEIGYHLFNLYGFSIIRQSKYFNNHIFFNSKRYNKSVFYCTTQEFITKLISMDRSMSTTKLITTNIDKNINLYAFPYNSPAFEIPYVLEHNGIKNSELPSFFFNLQKRYTYDLSSNAFCNNTEDAYTLNARIYELVRSNWFWSEEK